ncbi:unnamed protein product, partial [Prorocentrum cordatum]
MDARGPWPGGCIAVAWARGRGGHPRGVFRHGHSGAGATAGRDNEDVKEQRRQMRLAVADSTAPQSEAFSMVTGDLHWMVAAEDMLVKATAEASGQGDASEEQDASATLWRPGGFYELRQPGVTHERAQVWSRLDRLYWNASAVGQLDRWPQPIMTADQMHFEAAARPPAESKQNQVGVAVSFVRTAERGDVGVMQRCLQSLPRLRAVAPSPLELTGCKGAALDPYRSLILVLARDAAIGELADLRDHLAAQARWGRIHRALARLSPGRSTSLVGVVGPAGEVLSEPSATAAALRARQCGAFAERPVDAVLLEQW